MLSILTSVLLVLAASTAAAPSVERAFPNYYKYGLTSLSNADLCLSVDSYDDGAAVRFRKCQKIPRSGYAVDPLDIKQEWNARDGRVNTNGGNQGFCIDAGLNRYSGSPVTVWKCYDNYDIQAFNMREVWLGGEAMIKRLIANIDGTDWCVTAPPGKGNSIEGQQAVLTPCDEDVDSKQLFIGY